MTAALQMLKNEMFTSSRGDRDNVDNIGVVLTDGRSNDPQATWQNAMSIRKDGVNMISVGVGNANMKEMQAIATDPNGDNANIFMVDTFDNLATINDQLISAICNGEKIHSLLC